MVGTKDRTQSQSKIKNALNRITRFLNNNELVVNQSKTTILESMLKQKRTRQILPQPHLETIKATGEIKRINP